MLNADDLGEEGSVNTEFWYVADIYKTQIKALIYPVDEESKKRLLKRKVPLTVANIYTAVFATEQEAKDTLQKVLEEEMAKINAAMSNFKSF